MCCVACAVSRFSWLLFTDVPAWFVVLCVQCPGPLGSCSGVCPLGVLLCSVCCFACAVSWATWLLFTAAPARCVLLCVRCPGPLGSRSPVCPLGVLCCVCGVLGHLAPVHRCARSLCCVVCAVSWATWLLFTGAPAPSFALLVRCPGPLGSCSPVCPVGVLCCVCGVLGHLAPVHRCARSVCCVACAVSWPTWLLFTGAPARCAVLCVRCPVPLGSRSPVCPPGVLCCVCSVLGHLAPVHRCARSVCCSACAVPWATWLLFTGVPARCVVLCVRCLGSLGSCSPVCPRGLLCCVCGVLGHLAPVHRCARSLCCFARCVALRARCPGPLGSCSPFPPLAVLCCVCGVLGHLAPVHRCARWVCCVVCAASWATWLLFTGVPVPCFALPVRCPGPPDPGSPVCPPGVLCCVCGVLGHLALVHRCARSMCCVVRAVSWATWLLFTGVPARCVVLCVQCPGPLGSCSPVRPLGALCCRAVSWATWLLFTGVPAGPVVLCVRCPGPIGSCSRVRPLRPLLCSCGVLGHLAPDYRCVRSVCCFACAVSWATWLLVTGVPARCVVLRVRCPGPLGSCSPVRPLGGLCCVCGVLGHLAPVHPCARSVGCVVSTVSWAAWLLFTGVLALCAVLWVARGVLLCGASLRGAHSSIRMAAVCSRQGLGTLRARTRPSGRRLFVADRGWVPSGRALVHPDGGCSWPVGAGYPPGAHSSIRTAAGVARHLFLCRGSLGVVRALRVCGTRRPLLLGTCPCALVVAGGVPLWRASWPRVVRRASSGPVALGAPVGFPDAVVPFPTPGACAPGFTGWLRGAHAGRPRTGLIVPAAGPRRGRGAGLAPRRTRSGPRDGVVPGGSLRRRSWAACAAVVGVCGPGH